MIFHSSVNVYQRTQRIHLLLKSARNAPGRTLYTHGGSWMFGSPDTDSYAQLGSRLAKALWPQGAAPPIISWFLHPINYRYITDLGKFHHDLSVTATSLEMMVYDRGIIPFYGLISDWKIVIIYPDNIWYPLVSSNVASWEIHERTWGFNRKITELNSLFSSQPCWITGGSYMIKGLISSINLVIYGKQL